MLLVKFPVGEFPYPSFTAFPILINQLQKGKESPIFCVVSVCA